MKRLIYWPLILIGIAAAFHLLLTGVPFPVVVIDRLNSPKAVSAIENDSIKTSGGEAVPLSAAGCLREQSLLLEDILKHGVEVAASGEVFSLIRVHHWCGNDPVRYQLARVDLRSLAAMLEYDPGMRVSKFGIDPGVLGMLGMSPELLREVLSERRGEQMDVSPGT